LEQGRFGTQQKLQALIGNWSLRIGHWQLNSASPTAQWPSRWRIQSAGSILFDPHLEHPAADSRPQAPGNPFREVCKMSKNRRVSAAHGPH
jgi:hypothetical protein